MGLALITGLGPRLARAEGAVWRRSLDQLLVVAGSDILELRGPAAALWELLETAVPLGELVAELATAHAVPETQIAGDVHTTIDRLVGAGVLTSTDALRAAGIEPVVLKGPSLAHRIYTDPSMRPFGDIDLLIAPDDIDRTYALLADRGFQRRFPEPRPGFDRAFGKGAAFAAPDGLEIDVHRTFAAGWFGQTVDLAEARQGLDSFVVGGTLLHTLGLPQQLVATAMHAVLGTRRSRLLNLRDVAGLLRDDTAEEAVHLAESWRVDAVLAEGVRRVVTTYALDPAATPLAPWALANHIGIGQRVAMSTYTSKRRGYAWQALAAVPAVKGTRRRVAYLRAMALPERTYLEGRDRSRARRWLRMARSLTRRKQ